MCLTPAILPDQLYEKIRRSEQKYRVALEVLSYHSQSSEDEFQSIKQIPVPDTIQNITQSVPLLHTQHQ